MLKRKINNENTINHPFYLAIASHNTAEVQRCFNEGLDLDSIFSKYGTTPLHWAAAAGNEEIVRIVLEKFGHPEIKDKASKTPLDVARNNSIEKTLINYTSSKVPLNLLHKAALEPNNREGINTLLFKGADPTIYSNHDGRQQDNSKEINFLFPKGADPTICSAICSEKGFEVDRKYTALQMAIITSKGNPQTVDALAKASINQKLNTDASPLTLKGLALRLNFPEVTSIITKNKKNLKDNTLAYNIKNNFLSSIILLPPTSQTLEKIAPEFKINTSITSLKIEDIQMTKKTGEIFKTILTNNKYIKELSIKKVGEAYIGVDMFLKALGANNSITQLSLDNFDFNLHEQRILVDILNKHTFITHLSLNGAIQNGESGKIFFNTLRNYSLFSIAFTNNMFQIEDLVEFLKKNISLKILKVSTNLNDDLGFIMLTDYIKNTPSLTSLDFARSNTMTAEIFNLVVQSLIKNTSITYLALSLQLSPSQPTNDLLIKSPLNVVAELIKKNILITHLVLREFVGRDMYMDIPNFAKALQKNKVITHLSFINYSMNEKEATLIVQGLKFNYVLTHLSFLSNHADVKSTKVFAKSLKNNHHLISYEQTYMKEDNIKGFVISMKHNKFITNLAIPQSKDERDNKDLMATVEYNKLMVLRLANFLINKFYIKENISQENIPDIKIGNINCYKFYLGADKFLLNSYLESICSKIMHGRYIKADKEVSKKIEHILQQLKQYTTEHYLQIKGICKNEDIKISTILSKPQSKIADNDVEMTDSVDDKEVSENSFIRLEFPSYISDHIYNFIGGEESLWE